MLRKKVKGIIGIKLSIKLATIARNFLGGYSTKSYSQEGEDIILRKIFVNQSKGFYVDVGAHHPKRYSNTYFFYKIGWRGINIDPLPGSMKRFDRVRPRDINIEMAVSDKKQFLTYYGFNEPALNGFSKKISYEREGIDGYRIEFTKEIKTITLEEILDKYLPSGTKIDFLSVDVEGLDLKVLRSNNFKKYRPKVILVEILQIEWENIEKHKVTLFLTKYNYKILSKLVNTVVFVDEHTI